MFSTLHLPHPSGLQLLWEDHFTHQHRTHSDTFISDLQPYYVPYAYYMHPPPPPPPPPPPHLHTLLPTPSVTYYIHCQLPPFHTLPPTTHSDNIICALLCTLCILHIPPSPLPTSHTATHYTSSTFISTLDPYSAYLHTAYPPFTYHGTPSALPYSPTSPVLHTTYYLLPPPPFPKCVLSLIFIIYSI